MISKTGRLVRILGKKFLDNDNPVRALKCDNEPDHDKKLECLIDYVVSLSAGTDPTAIRRDFWCSGRLEHVICPSP